MVNFALIFHKQSLGRTVWKGSSIYSSKRFSLAVTGQPKISNFKYFVFDKYVCRLQIVVHDLWFFKYSISVKQVQKYLNKLK